MTASSSKNNKSLWTPPKLVQWISDDFEKRGLPSPHRLQAEQIVSHALNISRLDIYLQFDKPCTPKEQKAVRELVKRRYKREPTAYILGYHDFWSLRFKVGSGVLIPRQDTEVLVECILEKIQEEDPSENIRILELGTGSAAIPLALCSERTNLSIVTTELSKKALEYASYNLEKYTELIHQRKNCIVLLQGDRFQAINTKTKYDYIISNPPYIPKSDIGTLQEEVKEWEPSMALDGGEAGTSFYEVLLASTHEFLKPNGHLIFEHGFNQLQQLSDLVKSDNSLLMEENRKDYSGNQRVMILRKH